jgi:hypothetical protein
MTLLGAPLSTLLPAAAGAAVALVALYLLRPSRRRVEVPYARLWGLHVVEARATAIARRLRRWESLLLQLVIAALILLALADPHLSTRGAPPRHLILVDTSASMQARDTPSGPTRLERARREAEALLDALRPDEEAMIVGFDAAPHPLSPMTREEPVLRAAIPRIEASDAPDALLPALALAADALAGAAAPRLTIVSDGGFDGEALAALQRGLPALDGVEVRYAPVGGPAVAAAAEPEADNLAITAFSVRRYPANPSAYEILAEVRSFSSRPRHAKLTITQEGEPVEVTVLDLPPHGRAQRRLTDLAGEGRRLEARLAVDGPDHLALDDRAYALLPERKKARVLLAGSGDLYTEGALLLDRAVEVVRTPAAAYDPAKLDGFDAIVFDGFAPPAPPPRPALYLGCEAPACPFAVHGTLSAPIVTEIEREHPLLRWVALKDLNVSRSVSFTPARGDVALASSLGRPLLIAGERAGQRVIALGFSPTVSDLPLRVAFPVFLVNALQWLRGHAADAPDAIRTGQPERLPAPGELVEVTTPTGERLRLPVRDGRFELAAERSGYYAIGDGGRLLAANLGDARESSLASRALELGGKPVPAPAAAARLRPRAQLWRWLAIVALLLVLIEWWTFHRRWTV